MVRSSRKISRSTVVGTATPLPLTGKTINRLSRGSGSMKSLEENFRMEHNAAPAGVLTFTSSQRRRSIVAVDSAQQDFRHDQFLEPLIIGQQGGEAAGKPTKKESKRIRARQLNMMDSSDRLCTNSLPHADFKFAEGRLGLWTTTHGKHGMVRIGKLEPGLAAHEEGMRVGDIITHVDSCPIPSFDSNSKFEEWFSRLSRPLTVRVARPPLSQNIEYILRVHGLKLPSNMAPAMLRRLLTHQGSEEQELEAMSYDLQRDRICSIIKNFKPQPWH